MNNPEMESGPGNSKVRNNVKRLQDAKQLNLELMKWSVWRRQKPSPIGKRQIRGGDQIFQRRGASFHRETK
jgi:hypothetical protein